MKDQFDQESKRLFFALEIVAPWPEQYPVGRLIAEEQRHCTLAFLGQTHFPQIIEAVSSAFPPPPFSTGLVGRFDKCLFLPERHPHVVAWHIDWLEEPVHLITFQNAFVAWLSANGFHPQHSERPFLPHVTLCRSPFDPHQWKKAFTPLPLMTGDIHLFESLGHSQYKSLWSYPIKAPFEEIEHMADVAFHVRSDSVKTLHQHARAALAFRYPSLLRYFGQDAAGENLDDIIIDLNDLLAKADQEEGCPFKAVSFHGTIVEENESTLLWEMIVDV